MIRTHNQRGCDQRVKSSRTVGLWMLKGGFVSSKAEKNILKTLNTVSDQSCVDLVAFLQLGCCYSNRKEIYFFFHWWNYLNKVYWRCLIFFCFAWVEECFSSCPSPITGTNNNHPLWEMDERSDTLPWSISIKQSACQGRGLYVFEGSKEADRWVYGFTVEVGPLLLSGTPTHPGKHTNTLAFPSHPETWGGGGRGMGEGRGGFASLLQGHIYLYNRHKWQKKKQKKTWLFGRKNSYLKMNTQINK